MRMTKFMFSCAALVFFFLTPVVSLLAVPDPVEQVKPVIEKITGLLILDEYKNLPKEQQFARFFDLASERFDFDEMSKRVLGPQWNKLSGEQKKTFYESFSRLLGYTYMDKINAYNGEPVQYETPRIKGERAEVRTNIRFKDGNTVAISYIMQLKNNEWMAYDLVVENISMVRNYSEQLSSILKKNGFAALIQQIDNKSLQIRDAKK